MRRAAAIAPFLAILLASTAVAAAAPPTAGPDSGRPVPRFESLKTGAANGRRGPDAAQPALVQYRRAGLPLLIVAESGPWRRVRDLEGEESWMRRDLLSTRRTALARPARDPRLAIRAAPRPNARATALLEPGVVAEVIDCAGPWRRLQVAGRTGWAEARDLWGAADCAA